jgi:hypothetical protein
MRSWNRRVPGLGPPEEPAKPDPQPILASTTHLLDWRLARHVLRPIAGQSNCVTNGPGSASEATSGANCGKQPTNYRKKLPCDHTLNYMKANGIKLRARTGSA